MLNTLRRRLFIEIIAFLGLGTTLVVLRFVINVAESLWYVLALFFFGAIIIGTALRDPVWAAKARGAVGVAWDTRPITARTYKRLQRENALHRKRWRFIRELNAIYENRAFGLGDFDGSLKNFDERLRNWVRSLQELIAANPEFTADFPPVDLPEEPYDDERKIIAAFNDRASIIESMMGIRNGPLYRDLHE